MGIDRPGEPELAVALADDRRYVRVAAFDAAKDRTRPMMANDDMVSLRLPTQAWAKALTPWQRGAVERSLVDEATRLCAHDVDLETLVSAGDKAELLYRPKRPSDPGEPELVFAALTPNGPTIATNQFTAPERRHRLL